MNQTNDKGHVMIYSPVQEVSGNGADNGEGDGGTADKAEADT